MDNIITNKGPLTALNDTLQIATSTMGSVGIDVRGTFVGTITFQVSIDGENWISLPMLAVGSSTNVATATTTTAAGAWVGCVAGVAQFRARMTAYTSGSAMVTIRAEENPGVIQNFSNGATTQAVTITEGTLLTGTNYGLITAATTNGANIKATAGNLYELLVFNVTAATIYVKLYNKASAPTVGTDVPILTIPVAAGAVWQGEFGRIGKRFATGISIAVTGAAAATDATVIAAGAQISGTYI